MGAIHESCCAENAPKSDFLTPPVTGLLCELHVQLAELLPTAVRRLEADAELAGGGALVIAYPDVETPTVQYALAVANPRLSAALVDMAMGSDSDDAGADRSPVELASLVDIADLVPEAVRYAEICRELTEQVMGPTQKPGHDFEAREAFLGLEGLREVALAVALGANQKTLMASRGAGDSAPGPQVTIYGLGRHGYCLREDLNASIAGPS